MGDRMGSKPEQQFGALPTAPAAEALVKTSAAFRFSAASLTALADQFTLAQVSSGAMKLSGTLEEWWMEEYPGMFRVAEFQRGSTHISVTGITDETKVSADPMTSISRPYCWEVLHLTPRQSTFITCDTVGRALDVYRDFVEAFQQRASSAQ